MKNLLTKTLFISLLLSAIIPSGVQANLTITNRVLAPFGIGLFILGPKIVSARPKTVTEFLGLVIPVGMAAGGAEMIGREIGETMGEALGEVAAKATGMATEGVLGTEILGALGGITGEALGGVAGGAIGAVAGIAMIKKYCRKNCWQVK